jgi:uncharacterized membrane protein YphA (DoxX/SURF4 family)
MMLVILRLALGWHFLYEGVWKIRHADQFVGETEGFLSAARGPLAGYANRLVPDIDGHRRLEGNLSVVEVKDANGEPVKEIKLAKTWDDLRQQFVDYYQPTNGKEDLKKLHGELAEEAKNVYDRHVKGLKGFIEENGAKIKAHFESLKRHEEGVKTDPRTMFQRQRRWDEMQDLRKEAKGWIADLDSRENALKAELLDLMKKEHASEVQRVAAADKEAAEKNVAADKNTKRPKIEKPKATVAKSNPNEKPSDQPKDLSLKPGKAKGKEVSESGDEESRDAAAAENKAAEKQETARAKPQAAKEAAAPVLANDYSPLAEGKMEGGPFARSANPLSWTRTQLMACLLSWGMAAVGLCLMLGLFTRISALLGAGFMLFIVLCQPSYNGVWPLDPPQLGHALVVNKDFIEMTALLVIASTSLWRWTGLDYFVRCCCCSKSCDKTTTGGKKA